MLRLLFTLHSSPPPPKNPENHRSSSCSLLSPVCSEFCSGRLTAAMSTAKSSPSATVFSTTIKHFTCDANLQRRPRVCAVFTGTSISRITRKGLRMKMLISSSKTDPLEVCVKESVTVPNKLGDCPFTQRVLLTLEEKHLPYDMKFINFSNKPEWFLKINPEGKVPAIKLEDKWIGDSDVITQALEEKFPEPSLVTPPEKAYVGAKIFPTFVGFLKSKEPSDGTEQALLYELTVFNDYLKENGPLINGDKVSAADLSLGPKLYHLEIALGHYKNWLVPDSLSYVKSYMKTIFSLESFFKTRAQTEDVIEGWRPKVMG